MSENDLIFYMYQGNEIECHFDSIQYFIQPDYEGNKNSADYKVNMYLCKDDKFIKKVFCGTPEDLLNVKLDGDKVLKDNWDLFTVEYL